MIGLVIKKRIVSHEQVDKLYHSSAIASRSFVWKKFHPGAFTILCVIGVISYVEALYDLGANISFMPLEIFH